MNLNDLTSWPYLAAYAVVAVIVYWLKGGKSQPAPKSEPVQQPLAQMPQLAAQPQPAMGLEYHKQQLAFHAEQVQKAMVAEAEKEQSDSKRDELVNKLINAMKQPGP